MNRRDAIISLTALCGASAVSITPVTTHESQGVAMVIVKCPTVLSKDVVERLEETWKEAAKGTAFEQTRVLVLTGGLDIEFVRTKA